MLNAKLIVVGGDAKRTEVSLKQLPATIGRGRDATITLPHSLVSRKHCELFENDNQLFVRDLNSLNGTYLNNEKVTEDTSILPGQLLTLGNVTFRADYAVQENSAKSSDADTQRENIEVDTENVADKQDTDHAHGPSRGLLAAGNHAADIAAENFEFEGEQNPANQSVAFQQLNELPAAAAQASFAGQVDPEDDPKSYVDPNSVNIELGSEKMGAVDPTQSSLDDFFRKMPR